MIRILAVAIGPTTDLPIKSPNPVNVRPYVTGLIEGLTDWQIGTDYDIWYRERPRSAITNAFGAGGDNKQNDLIFPMSTTVVRAAANAIADIPIVFPSASDTVHDIGQLGPNVAGINAQRSQTAATCFDDFLQSVPTLTSVYFLHSRGYGPSERARGLIEQEAHRKQIDLRRLDVTETTLTEALSQLPVNDPTVGVLVLPIDFCIGEAPNQAPTIIGTVQGGKSLPTFFPIPDWVRGQPTAFGAYGVSQLTCGTLAAGLIDQIWQGTSPDTLGVRPAPPGAFEWVVSQTVADDLNIALPDDIQACVIP